MAPEEMIEEASEAFPGCVALARGYWPLGADTVGTGDQVFISLSSDRPGNVLIIPHDDLEEDGSLPTDSPILMLDDLDEIFEFFAPRDAV